MALTRYETNLIHLNYHKKKKYDLCYFKASSLFLNILIFAGHTKSSGRINRLLQNMARIQ